MPPTYVYQRTSTLVLRPRSQNTHKNNKTYSNRVHNSYAVVCCSSSLTPAAPGRIAANEKQLGENGHVPEVCKRTKTYDIVTLSNLCVDIVVPVETLPKADPGERSKLLQNLTDRPPSTDAWEVGGNTNTLIAAARLGMKAAAVGQVGKDVYGGFLVDVLKHEGVDMIVPIVSQDDAISTLLCFVLVDSNAQHTFCSRYDFGPWPLFDSVKGLPDRVKVLLESTAALFINGFVFDEIPAPIILEAALHAQRAGAAVLFDPGPRAWTFGQGERREAMESMLRIADVVLMTQEEAAAVTGIYSAEGAARWILEKKTPKEGQGTQTEWCIIKKGAEGALLASKYPEDTIVEQAALKVDVRDTVGCGDSFAAAVALGYTRGHSIPSVMALASAVGAATAMGSGAGRNVARAEDVIALLAAALPDCRDGRHEAALQVLSNSMRSG